MGVNKVQTKKMLVPINMDNPKKTYKGFVYPNFDSNSISSFVEINSDKIWENAMVVYTGKTLTKEDVFSKIVDSGKQITSVSTLLKHLDDYLGQIKGFKVGDKLRVESSPNGFKLVKVNKINS